MDKDFKAIENISSPLTLYKDEQAEIAVQEK